MTTIAWDGYSLAADRLMADGTLKAVYRKIHKVGKYWYGQAGTVTDAEWCRHWIAAGARLDAWIDDLRLEEGTHGLLVEAKTGNLFAIDGSRPILIPILNDYYATGSGSHLAIAAMSLGKTAVEAIHVASQHDINTGNEVDVVHIRKRPRKR